MLPVSVLCVWPASFARARVCVCVCVCTTAFSHGPLSRICSANADQALATLDRWCPRGVRRCWSTELLARNGSAFSRRRVYRKRSAHSLSLQLCPSRSPASSAGVRQLQRCRPAGLTATFTSRPADRSSASIAQQVSNVLEERSQVQGSQHAADSKTSGTQFVLAVALRSREPVLNTCSSACGSCPSRSRRRRRTSDTTGQMQARHESSARSVSCVWLGQQQCTNLPDQQSGTIIRTFS
jgi:hypothetical protein